jgi:hypothetical protein
MRYTILSLFAVLCLVPVAVLAEDAKDKAETRGKLEGTWRLVGFMEDGKLTEAPKGHTQLKLVTATHFTWATYDNDNGEIQASAGGTYTLKGDSYKEMVRYVHGDFLKELVGKEQPFTYKLEGNRWYHTGTLTTGFKIDEVWERVK